MRKLVHLFLVLLITSCKQGGDSNMETTSPETSLPVHQTANTSNEKPSELSADMYRQIKEHYINEYGEGLEGVGEVRFEEKITDTTIELLFREVETEMPLAAIYLSPKLDPNLVGDLTNDTTDDIVIYASVEGCGGGGNAYCPDVILFLNEKGTYRLTGVTLAREVSGGCGNYTLKKIENNLLHGTTLCPEDGADRWGPHLECNTTAKAVVGKLVFLSKKNCKKMQ